MNQHIHLIGIGGTGMGPLAKILLEMGADVSGSDLQPSETTDYLTRLGATIHFGHSKKNLNGATKVVYSTAISQDNPEILAARERGIYVCHRSELLAQLLNERRSIAVGGAHGKTTVTSMISWVLEQGGVDPTVVIGARFAPFGPGAKYGRGQFLVAEADESDRSFLRYHPEVAVVTSIEADHLENYNGAFKELVGSYEHFLANRKEMGIAILGIDDPVVFQLSPRIRQAVTYGFRQEADFRAEVLRLNCQEAHFRVYWQGAVYGEFTICVPGRHNIANALACIVACHYVGLKAEVIKESLATFQGAQRRFQVIGEPCGVLIVDDYAHHPTEVEATIRATKESFNRRVVAVFQPHRYSRTQFLMDEFARAFTEADCVVLTDIYAPPPELPIPGVSTEVLAGKIRDLGLSVTVVHERKKVAGFLAKFVRPQDVVLVMGAGSIWESAYELLGLLQTENR